MCDDLKCDHNIDGECQLIGWPDDGSCPKQNQQYPTDKVVDK